MKDDKIKLGIAILEKSIESNITIEKASSLFGKQEWFVRKLNASIEHYKSKGLIGDLDLYRTFKTLYNTKKKSINNNHQKRVDSESILLHSANRDVKIEQQERYETRNTVSYIRGEDGKIEKYYYKILRRDDVPLTGYLSREDVEKIYENYPYITRNMLSMEFPYMTDTDLKKILIAFNITKDKKFPAHILEEHSEDEIAEFALKAKERASYKKLESKQIDFVIKQYRDLQQEHFYLKQEQNWATSIIAALIDNPIFSTINNTPKYAFKPKNNTEHSGTLFALFGDIHIGKKFETERTMYGRGNNIDILKERFIQIQNDIIEEYHFYKKKEVVLISLGDIFESIMPEGMHSEHYTEMDILGAEQMIHAVAMFKDLLNNLHTVLGCSIYMYGIGGNHDRIGIDRNQDRKRTASTILYRFLSDILFKDNPYIKVIAAKESYISIEHDGVSVIGFHGDNGLAKRKTIEIINLFKKGDAKNFTVVANGHFHEYKVNEGVNYMSLQTPSICSVDDYVQNNLGLGTQPGFVTLRKKANGVSVNKHCLY